MKEFFRWVWEIPNLLSRALNWIYKHPRHVLAGAVLILIAVYAVDWRGGQASDRGHAPPAAEPSHGASPRAPPGTERPHVAPRPQLPPLPAPTKYTDADQATRDLEELGREHRAVAGPR